MTTEWRELKTLQDVAAAQAAGEEIECISNLTEQWYVWDQKAWHVARGFRSRPKKRTKKIVLREGFFCDALACWTNWYSGTEAEKFPTFVRWLDTPAREIEVGE